METTFRKVEYNEEIIHLLQSYVQNKWSLLLWQAHDRSLARDAVVTNFDSASRQVVLKVSDLRSIDLSKTVYCHGEEKKLVFKSNTMAQIGGELALRLPDDVRLFESRANPRFEMFSNKKAYITVVVSSHYESKETSYVFKMNDISTTGFSMVMHSSNTKNFSVGQKIKVTQIGSDIINIPFTATVVHLVPLKSQGRAEIQLYKVGVVFSKKIIFYNYFLTRHLEW